ncbi:hypothetical protein R52603_00270 [Paraburkholderia saeva]|uniref:DUF2282 domain-containing protein n=2 Tax=Paraburkholderia saeva TaxID=2777537 RepID=A0A9N8RVT0_9BURK|nr:hypothetical protein R52603_00270 [Paraburkholderia saeva]CAG4894311.1 hypothetical protein LMG31841_01889 [Paraburkholderia saeva]CAG4899062.1 hypothetical protein R70241_02567 [Paraburkholderia saeva]
MKMKSCRSLLVASAIAVVLPLAACSHARPVEFSAGAANDPDFAAMDQSMAQCKSISRNAATDQCSKIRAYESCMKSKGYITVLGPENPKGCGDPAWESDVRKWLN